MGEHQLEQVMLDFWEKRFDVLVCTTIVESGLDISNANTMIIDASDTLGLSQLHQLRGRVGRSRERAYAYFLYPPEKPLTETADERLPRWPALGPRRRDGDRDEGPRDPRRGQPARRRAVRPHRRRRLRPLRAARRRGGPGVPPGRPGRAAVEVKIELPVDAHLPHDYIGSERLRLEMYKRFAEVRSDEDVKVLQEELLDRYGAPPDPVTRLLVVASFRARARAAGLSEITVQGKYVRFHPVDLPESRVVRLGRLYPKSIHKARVRTMLVPRPRRAGFGGQAPRDEELLAGHGR